MKATITIRIDIELREQLEALAKKERRNLSDLIRIILEDRIAAASPTTKD